MLFCLAAPQTAAGLKLVVSPNYLDKDLMREVFIAGYVAGSTRGSAATLLAFMLTQLRLEPWDVPEVQAFMLSVARLKVTFVVYQDGQSRAIDAWRALDTLSSRPCACTRGARIHASPWRQRIHARLRRQLSRDPSSSHQGPVTSALSPMIRHQ